ncbi:arsenate reductase ArsC [Ramlibacter sp. MAHUQ-53]|uniref:arsenate reductase ArsC n=1 Tax=unclassified Ramlibacter TaxID=2617605 RepID=UPI00363A4859
MTEPTYNILFVCTANSARSIIAEALTNALAAGRFKAWSAGSQPSGAVHPMALQELRRLGIPVDGLRSKGWAEFAAPGAPQMDFVFTVCDQAAGEACPVWPGQPVTAHWGMPDPAAAQGSEEARLRAFRDVAVMMKRRLELLLALPVERLDRMAMQHHVREIGQS